MRSAIALWTISACLALPLHSAASEFARPWMDPSNVLVLDPFGPNTLDFEKLGSDKRVVGIIHQASSGLNRVDNKYLARKSEAKRRGYLWGSYHLLTTADVKKQIDGYLATVGTNADEVYAIDVECLSTDEKCQSAAYKVTIDQVLMALRYFRQKNGNFPLLYTNGSVKNALAPVFRADPDLRSVQLWYARFRPDISDFFPDQEWKTYSLWQFSSEINCNPAPGPCPYRVPGTAHDMDVNVFFGTEQHLRDLWPLNVIK
jgi:GH25 family lysozyme M1 (1,4-beta-N-acetylmuramidase)